jgi:hypothetical protein
LYTPATHDPDQLIGTRYIKQDLGGISDMTLWRWENHPDPTVRLPPPDLIIGGNKKKLRKLGTYLQWKQRVLTRGRISLPRAPKTAVGKPIGGAAWDD